LFIVVPSWNALAAIPKLLPEFPRQALADLLAVLLNLRAPVKGSRLTALSNPLFEEHIE
jgi:hypothetical protein